jgi:hypothetical protein
MGTLNCASNGFAEMELGRKSRRSKCIGQIVKYWYQTMCLGIDNLAKQSYEWQKSDMSVRRWTME